jgi:tetratricopeptide (TPR) repeat protein
MIKDAFMRRSCMIVMVFYAVFLAAGCARADEKEWLELTDKAIGFYQKGQHEEAIATARQALKVGEATFGPEDLKIVGSIDDLASYLQAVGKYDESEALYRRALAILEKKLPPNDRYLAIFMDYLANFFEKIGKTDEAAKLKARAKSIRFGDKKPTE